MKRGVAVGGAAAAALLVGFALRALLLSARDVFFDELATVWFATQSLDSLPTLLASDSASPLHLLATRALFAVTPDSVTVARWLSLAFGMLAIAIVAAAPALRRTSAALILAILPAHWFFSTEARAYALTALLIGAAVILLAMWSSSGRAGLLAGGTAAIVAAAYAHGYGALFLPLPAILGLAARRKEGMRSGLTATGVALLAFLPGIWLALRQPPESLAWMQVGRLGERLAHLAGIVPTLGFAPSRPDVFIPDMPVAIVAAGSILLAVGVVAALREREAMPYLIALALPVAGVIGLALAGRTLYFPLRFESVLAVPLAAALALGIARLPSAYRAGWLVAAVIVSGWCWAATIQAHAQRPEPPLRVAARAVRSHIPADRPIIASGYAYLEVVSQRDPDWHPEIHALPLEQRRHPGWYAALPDSDLSRELSALRESIREPFVWVGQVPSVEWDALQRVAALRPVHRTDHAVVALGEFRP